MTLIAGSSSGLWGETGRAAGQGSGSKQPSILLTKSPPLLCRGHQGGGNKQDLTRQRATAQPHSYTLGGGDSGYSSSYLGYETMQIQLCILYEILHLCERKNRFLISRHLGPHKSLGYLLLLDIKTCEHFEYEGFDNLSRRHHLRFQADK